MITRNEEAFISGCLRAAKPAVDEIIVVDTGSTDGTIEIARSFGAKVYRSPWRDDFSAPRNESLRKASGDWALVLDADELLEDGGAGLVRKATAEGKHSGFFLPVISRAGENKSIECLMVRLFVNRPEIRYRYLIHEQMLPDLTHYARQSNKPIGVLSAKIQHKGYLPQVMKERGKIERNRKIFGRQLDLYPRDTYSWYKFSDFLILSGAESHEVLGALKRSYALLEESPGSAAGSFPFAGEVAAALALGLYENEGAAEQGLSILEKSAARFSPTPHLFHAKAGLEMHLRRFQDAIRSYRRCLALAGRSLMVPVSEGTTTWKPLTGIGLCLIELGHLEKAKRMLSRSIRKHPKQVNPYAGLAEISWKTNDPESAIRELNRLLEIDPGNVPALRSGGDILEHMGLLDKANAWRRKAEIAGNQPSNSEHVVV